MSSAGRSRSQIQPNKLWTNILSITSSIVDSNNVLVTWAQGNSAAGNNYALGLLSTPGSAVLRDMGKTVRLPVATGGGSYSIRTLRKVQRVTQAAVTTTNDGVIATAAASPQYGVFYISLGVNDSANAVRAVKFARVTIPN